MQVDITGESFDPSDYDAINGDGEAEHAIKQLREALNKKPEMDSVIESLRQYHQDQPPRPR